MRYLILAMSVVSVIAAHMPEAVADVCDRTPQVRDKLVETKEVASCDLVTDEGLSTIVNLDLSNLGITAFKNGDLAGLDSLLTLNLENNELTVASFPEGTLYNEQPIAREIYPSPGIPVV